MYNLLTKKIISNIGKNNYFLTFSAFNSFSSTKIDYYEILGVSKNATQQEIKEAYINQAKKFHPDVNTTGKIYEPNGDKFRQIAEAYAILGQPTSRLNYDTLNQSNPNMIYREERQQNLKKYQDIGIDGQIKKQGYKEGTYAYEKQEYLKEERKKFNVDAFGRYRGGLPQKGKLNLRGEALGNIGAPHDVLLHNLKSDPDPSVQYVTTEDAMHFKNAANEDIFDVSKKKFWFRANINYNFFRFESYRTGWRWFRNIFLLFFGISTALSIHARRTNKKVLQKIKQLKQLHPEQNKFQIANKTVTVSPQQVVAYTN